MRLAAKRLAVVEATRSGASILLPDKAAAAYARGTLTRCEQREAGAPAWTRERVSFCRIGVMFSQSLDGMRLIDVG